MVSANPTGPITVASARNGAYGDSVARLLEFAGHERRARVLLQRRRRADGALPRARSRRVRRGEQPPEDGYQGDYIAELAARGRRSGAARCSSGSRRRWSASGSTSTRWARQSELEQRPRRDPARALPTYEHDGALFVRSTDFGDDEGPRARPLGRAGRAADLRGRRRRLPARQARARLRPRDLRARRRPPRRRRLVRGDRAHARLRPGAGRGAALPARAPDPRRRADEDVEARAAMSSSSTTSSTRSASTSRAGSSSTAATTRRSRSTSTSPPSSRARTRSTTSSTSHARIERDLPRGAGRRAASTRSRTARSRPRSAS